MADGHGPRAQLFQRHDLVWLTGSADGPLTVARRTPQDLAAGQLRLGRCTVGDRTAKPLRHSLAAPESAVHLHRPALRVEEAAALGAALPPVWRLGLEALGQLAARFNLALRVYGSLSWEALAPADSAAAGFLRPGSDLDLLVDLGGADAGVALPELLSALAQLSAASCKVGGPALDGELRVPGVGDVAWREVLSALAHPAERRLLVKDALAVRLVPLAEVLRACAADAVQPGAADFTVCGRLDRWACAALRAEALAWPKPGLVSPVDRGSHADMDIQLMLRAIDALRGWFGELARAARCGAEFSDLACIGRAAEQAMLRATGGVNAYQGAIFNLGLLVAAAASAPIGVAPQEWVRRRWGTAILRHGVPENTHGALVRRRDQAGGAPAQAAAGYPALAEAVLPSLRQALAAGHPPERALLAALLAGVAALEDSNLLWRGGREGLAWAQQQARDCVARQDLAQPDWRLRLAQLHAKFVARRLSPGGSADLIACAHFLLACEAEWV